MKSLFAISCLAAGTAAHTIFQEFWVDGVSQGHKQGVRVVQYNGPVTNVSSPDIICNTASNGGWVQPYPPPLVITAPAGASAIAEWHHDLNGRNPQNVNDPIDISHLGPTIVYMAKVPDARQTNVEGLQWFKIFEDGLDAEGRWGVNRLHDTEGKLAFTIPECIPSGQYLIRSEIIALHSGQTYPGTQFYMGCAQVNVVGGGNASPATVSFPGAYAGSDPGITFNLYWPKPTSYIIPGPEVFTCPA